MAINIGLWPRLTMPQADPIVQAEEVRLVDDDYPSPKREKVAKYIDENWNDEGGLSLTHISEETGTSRQHVKNTLTAHFEAVNPKTNGKADLQLDRDGLDADMLELILEAYRKGYQDGRDDEKQSGLAQLLGSS